MRLFSILLAFTLFSCTSGYKGYENYSDNIQYKLISFGEGEEKIQDSTFLRLMFRYCTTDKCNDDTPFQATYVISNHNYSDFWNSFHVGDRFVLLIDSNPGEYWKLAFEFKNKKVQWPVIVEVKITSSYNNNFTFIGEKDSGFLRWREEQELIRLKHSTITQNGESSEYVEKNGCFINIVKQGYGDSIFAGSEVILSYKAYFSTGKKFDDTELWEDSLKFEYGLPFQIIRGLELGIQGLREGCESKIIIPSHLAFGEQGSSSGIVPPFEPLLYDLKIISVSNSPL